MCGIDLLLPSAIMTLMEMLLGESSLLEVLEEMEFEREGIMAVMRMSILRKKRQRYEERDL